MQGKKWLAHEENYAFLGPSDIKSIAEAVLQQCNKSAAGGDIFCEQREKRRWKFEV